MTTRGPIPHEDYATSVIGELSETAPDFAGPAGSVYFGGGTPSLWSAAAVGRVIGAVRSTLGLGARAEVTLEVNPEGLTAATLSAFRAQGVNRLSLGAQSLDDSTLQALGRHHTGDDVVRAVAAARAAGFENVSLDLIHGWRGQTVAAALADLEQLLALGPEHVSLYQLTIEPHTRFGADARRGIDHLADENALVEMFSGLRATLRAAGVQPYEISNAARPGFEAVHNSGYWRGAAYLGLGAGAHGYRPLDDGRAVRWVNERHPQRYMRTAQAGQTGRSTETLDAEMHRFERLMTGLRLDEGHRIDAPTRDRFGAVAHELSDEGLLERTAERWSVSDRGRALLDTVVARFFDVL